MLDYPQIAARLGRASIVGVGESTHGTHEFFQIKVELFRELVQNQGFNTFYLESIDDSCDAIDRYIRDGKGHVEDLINKLFYVHRTSEILNLVTWLRANRKKYPVRFIGIDQRKYVSEYAANYDLNMMKLRDKRMALVVKKHLENNPGSKGMIWAHDTHVAMYINPPEWMPDTRQVAMGEHLHNWFGSSYYSVAQLFGSGYFNAALIDEQGNFDNSQLVPHYARKVSKWFWENRFTRKIQEPMFLQGPCFGGLARPNEALYKRALGWGVQRSVMHDQNNVMYIDIGQAFDGIIFVPRTTASHLLKR